MGDVSLLNPQIALVNGYQHEDYSDRAAMALGALDRADIIAWTLDSALYSFLQALLIALGILTLTRLLTTWKH